MRMRLRVLRGQKVRNLHTGEEVTVLDSSVEMCKVLNKAEKLEVLYKSALDLPVIDTKDYEKL